VALPAEASQAVDDPPLVQSSTTSFSPQVDDADKKTSDSDVESIAWEPDDEPPLIESPLKKGPIRDERSLQIKKGTKMPIKFVKETSSVADESADKSMMMSSLVAARGDEASGRSCSPSRPPAAAATSSPPCKSSTTGHNSARKVSGTKQRKQQPSTPPLPASAATPAEVVRDGSSGGLPKSSSPDPPPASPTSNFVWIISEKLFVFKIIEYFLGPVAPSGPIESTLPAQRDRPSKKKQKKAAEQCGQPAKRDLRDVQRENKEAMKAAAAAAASPAGGHGPPKFFFVIGFMLSIVLLRFFVRDNDPIQGRLAVKLKAGLKKRQKLETDTCSNKRQCASGARVDDDEDDDEDDDDDDDDLPRFSEMLQTLKRCRPVLSSDADSCPAARSAGSPKAANQERRHEADKRRQLIKQFEALEYLESKLQVSREAARASMEILRAQEAEP